MLQRLALSLLASTGLLACVDLGTEDDDLTLSSEEQESCVHRNKLANLKRQHERYRDIKVALADGYELGIVVNGVRVVDGCISHPTMGAMGYHYFKPKRFNDAKIHELKPEVLVYQNDNKKGTLELGAVEWVVPQAAWEAKHGVGAPPPEVYGNELMVLNPALGWYVGHAWLWRPNPSGVFSDWNPDVTCPPPPLPL